MRKMRHTSRSRKGKAQDSELNSGDLSAQQALAHQLERLLAALDELDTNLRAAFGESATTVMDQRSAQVGALISLARFVHVAIDSAYGNRIFDLASAIGDLDAGTVSRLLAPAATHTRRPDASALWRARVFVVLGVAADARAKGCSLADAAKVVAPEFQQLAGRKAKGVLARTVEGWRKEVSSGRVKNFVAREVLKVGLEIVSGKSAGDCEQLAADFFSEASKLGGFSPAY